MAEAANRGDSLVVAVVMDQGNLSFHGGRGEQQISWWHSAVIPATSQGQLRLPRTRPEASGHRDCLESSKAAGDLLCTSLIWSKTSQLKDDQIADQHQTRLYSSVEPLRKPGKAPVADPGPNAGIEKSRAIELRRLQLGLGAQERSLPAATSRGVPSTSRITSNPLRTRRLAASRNAALTVSLSPLVPSSRRAASSARSSTSTVVRVMHIIVAHHFRDGTGGVPLQRPGPDAEGRVLSLPSPMRCYLSLSSCARSSAVISGLVPRTAVIAAPRTMIRRRPNSSVASPSSIEGL